MVPFERFVRAFHGANPFVQAYLESLTTTAVPSSMQLYASGLPPRDLMWAENQAVLIIEDWFRHNRVTSRRCCCCPCSSRTVLCLECGVLRRWNQRE